MKKHSKYAYQDRQSRRVYGFIKDGKNAQDTGTQFFQNIAGLGHINLIYRGRVIARRGY